MIAFRLLVLLALAGGAAFAQGSKPAVQAGLSITFLANEGILLTTSDAGATRKVLIDALFEPYESFAVPAESTRVALHHANAPFDDVDLVLVTHRHGDHFHPRPAVDHLRANPRAVLVTSRQVIDSLQGRLTSELLRGHRIAPRTLAAGSRRRLLVNGIPVELLGLPHDGRRHRGVEHLAFIVDLGGRRVLHVGDAELSEATLAAFRIDTMRIDVALLPFWALTDDDTRNAVQRWIRPRHVVAFHLAADDPRAEREVRSAVPAARVLRRPLESMHW